MFDNRKKSTARVLMVLWLAVGVCFAQTNTEKLRQAAVTPEKLSASFATVAKAVEPAVVNIDTKSKTTDIGIKETPGNSDDLSDMNRRQRRPIFAVGSGFIVDKAGYILTNSHVVEDAARIFVQLQNGEEFIAKVVGTDEETDLAVLKIEAGRDLPFLKLADSEKAQVGDWVLAVGSPFGLAQTVTAGIISQVKRETPTTVSKPFQKFIQTDAAINRGNSGGPLVNMDGEVIGVNSQIATSTGDYNGIGFALPSNEAGYVFRQIVENGKVRRGYLGVGLDSVKAEFAKVYDLPEPKGAIITNIADKKSAAALAGLQAGDIILEFNGQKVLDAQDLIEKVAVTAPDQTANVTIVREVGANLERRTLPVKLAERPSSSKIPADETLRRPLPIDNKNAPVKPFGLTLTEMTPTVAASYKIENQRGLIIKEISPTSFIADLRSANGAEALQEGDIILRINRANVTDLKTFNEIVGKLQKGDAVVLHILSNTGIARVFQPRIVQFTVK